MARPSKRLVAERRRLLGDFPDIEYDSGDLKSNPAPAHARRGSALEASDYEAQAEYYRLAGAFLHGHRFTSEEDKTIWALHVEGVPYREIAAQTGTYVRRVNDTVGRLRAEMLGEKGGRGGSMVEQINKRLRRMPPELLLAVAPLFLGEQ